MSALTGLATALAAACGLLILLAVAVVSDRPHGPVTAAASGVAPFVLQVGWPCLVLGLAAPRWWLAAPAAVCSVAGLAVAAMAAPRGTADPQAPGDTLRVVTANLFYMNDNGADTWPIIEAFNPDLVLLQEVSTTSAGWLPPPGWHAEIDSRTDAFGTAVLTRIPALASERVDLGGLPQLMIQARVGDHEISALSLHPRAPVSLKSDRQWREQFRALVELVTRESAKILVVAGDFNATPVHGPMRSLLRTTGLVDARPRRRRFQNTWPSGQYGSPTLVRRPIMSLDHVLVRGAAVRSVRVLHGGTSDHHPLAVELALPPSN